MTEAGLGDAVAAEPSTQETATDLLTLLESGLGAAAKAGSTPALRPKPAATLILIDRSGDVPLVLLGKRHAGHVFMPGKFVFPGGRIEPSDRRMNVAGALASPLVAKLGSASKALSPDHSRALALAAIRETFEETGLLIGTGDMGAPADAPEGAWRDFAAHGIFPTLEPLHLIARAITPPRRPRRFDTTFFAVDAAEIAHRVEGVVGPSTELVELKWLPLADALALDLPQITIVVLRELKARLAAGMAHRLPVPFYHVRHGRWHREEL